MEKPTTTTFADGVVVCGSFPEDLPSGLMPEGGFPLVIADPPYGGIVSEPWDKGVTSMSLLRWAEAIQPLMAQGGALYYWGGVGTPCNRPFFEFLACVERETPLRMANLITWAKKRAYGVQHNYLFTREECAYFVNGDPKKPLRFEIPLLATLRGYAGYDAEYPAKSEFLRRTNVWTDITEVLRGKVHPTQKADRVIEIPIEVHTVVGDWVLDPFVGSGTTALACRRMGRRFVCIERDPEAYALTVSRLEATTATPLSPTWE